jgi:prepilin-type N-terminal cleavage/methylation domain-containing protein
MAHHTQREHSRARGYTLIEMLVVIAIISIVMPTLLTVIIALYREHHAVFSEALAVTKATDALGSMVRDIRSATYGADGSLPIAAIAPDSLAMFTDTDGDGSIEHVRYFLDGTTIKRGTIEPTATATYPPADETVETLATDIVNDSTGTPLFRFYSATSSEITTTSRMLDIRRIEVRVIAQVSFIHQATPVTLHSSASIRNLKEDY